MRHAKLPLPILNALLKYLSKQPWDDVNDLITALGSLSVLADEHPATPPKEPAS